jgi:mono/diheme cytochrome c family protein
MRVRVQSFIVFGAVLAAVLCAPRAARPIGAAGQDPAAAAADPSAPRSVWDGVYTEEQAKRGELVYGEFCAACHGSALNGGEMAGPLNGPIFTSNWNGVSVADLFDRIRTTMPLDRPGVLTRQQNADVLAYMFHSNKFPVGKGELANRSEMLKAITFTALKPEGKPAS